MYKRAGEKEFTLRNGPADTFITSQMGYISIPSSAVFLMKRGVLGFPL